jgi:hypothetical protein
MTAGRPTLYREIFVNKVDEYLNNTGDGTGKLPTFQGFALYIGVSCDSLERWSKEYPEFCGALEKLKNKQAEQLINDGIYGGKEVNATIVKLLLQNNHGMKERVDNTSNGETLKGLVGLETTNEKET